MHTEDRDTPSTKKNSPREGCVLKKIWCVLDSLILMPLPLLPQIWHMTGPGAVQLQGICFLTQLVCHCFLIAADIPKWVLVGLIAFQLQDLIVRFWEPLSINISVKWISKQCSFNYCAKNREALLENSWTFFSLFSVLVCVFFFPWVIKNLYGIHSIYF